MYIISNGKMIKNEIPEKINNHEFFTILRTEITLLTRYAFHTKDLILIIDNKVAIFNCNSYLNYNYIIIDKNEFDLLEFPNIISADINLIHPIVDKPFREISLKNWSHWMSNNIKCIENKTLIIDYKLFDMTKKEIIEECLKAYLKR